MLIIQEADLTNRTIRLNIMLAAMLLMLLVLALTISFDAVYAADSGKDTWTDDGTGLVLSYFPGDEIMIAGCDAVPSDGIVEIPEEINGRPVTSISAKGFQGNEEIVELYLPDSVNSLYSGTFMSCKNLRKVKLPSGIATISSDLFRECSSLEEVDIPDGVTTISARAFYCCNRLKSITLPASVNSVNTSDSPFLNCPSLQSINVSEENKDYTSVDGVLFTKDMSTLVRYPEGKTDERYDIPAGVTTLEIGALQRAQFSYCTIPSGIEVIPAFAFEGAANLSEIVIPEGVTSIEADSFYHADSLARVTLPETLTSIGGSAFYFCHFTSIEIPASVSSIGRSAFMHTFLKSITIPDGVTTIPATMLSESSVQYVHIPDTVTSLDVTAVRYAGSLEALFVPASVKMFTNQPGDIVPFNVRSDKFTLYGESGSAVETYADEHNIRFVAISREEFESKVQDGTLPGYVEEDNTGGSGGSGSNDDDLNKDDESEKGTEGRNDDTDNGSGTEDTGGKGSTADRSDIEKSGGNTGSTKEDKSLRARQSIKAPGSVSKTTNSKVFSLGAKAKTKLSYTSSNKKVATVDSAGRVTVLGPGTTVITIKASKTGKYSEATKQTRITVSLAAPRLKAVNHKGSKIKLTWTKSRAADGYMVYVKAPGEKKFRCRLKKAAKVKSITHMGLQNGKTYSYKIRSYKKVGGKTIYSAYSKVRKVKVNK